MFQTNEVLNVDETLYRVLATIDEYIVWIEIEDDSVFPEIVRMSDLIEAINEERLNRVDDPFRDLFLESPEPDTTAFEKREHNFALIKPIVTLPDFYDPKSRSKAINQIIASQGSTKQTLYRLIRRYWQRGQTPNALLPDYKNSGAKGKRRFAKEKKLGRPRTIKPGVGALVDPFIERLFRIVIDRHILIKKRKSFPYAHRRFETLYRNYFPDIPESELPSFWQMKHFYDREYSLVEKIEKKTDEISFNKDIRPLTSTANTQVLGAGSRYEIDATIADIYLVSDSERHNITGRPVVYVVIDVFSRMVAGFYIGFENPSYAAAIQSLYTAVVDKTELCQQLGFDISPQDWPCIGLPDKLLADRGELMGHQIESLEKIFHVQIGNTPPYRGDAKGIVERSFKTIQEDFKPFAPGVVTGSTIKKRGDSDYRLDAKLSIKDFSRIVLSSILYHNRFKVLKHYDRDADIPSDMPLTPLNLWNWSLQARTGRLRSAESGALKIALMPRVKINLSKEGIKAFGVIYTCQQFIEQGWGHRKKGIKRPQALEAAYDPANANHIYLFPEKNSNKFWTCNLSDKSRQYINCSFWDVWSIQNEQKRVTANADLESNAQKREHEEYVLKQIQKAEKEAPKIEHVSKAQRISEIKSNKRNEVIKERQERAYHPNKDIKKGDGKVVYISQSEPDVDFPDYIDKLFDEDD